MKKEHGQFYTTNYDYILQDFVIPENVEHIIEPFGGKGDLFGFLDKDTYTIEAYDIEPKHEIIVQKDTLLEPPDYKDKFVLTNPPFLARNKSDNKAIFDKYDENDLYKCFIRTIIENNPCGGILILPLNFWSSIRKNDVKLRTEFLSKFSIQRLNIFEENVFVDTTYTVCSLLFILKNSENIENKFKCSIYPQKKIFDIELNKINNYTFGGEIYSLEQNNTIKIERLTSKNQDTDFKTNILVQCIDMNADNKIKLSYVDNDDIYIDDTPKQSARTYATLITQPKLSVQQQKKLVKDFNEYLDTMRKKYHSLFLTNYRESKKIARKRISFKLVFEIVNHVLSK